MDLRELLERAAPEITKKVRAHWQNHAEQLRQAELLAHSAQLTYLSDLAEGQRRAAYEIRNNRYIG